MMLKEIAEEYEQNNKALLQRIEELDTQRKRKNISKTEYLRMSERISALKAIYRDNHQISVFMRTYYSKTRGKNSAFEM